MPPDLRRFRIELATMSSRVDRVISGRNLHTAHPGSAYPGLRSVRPGPGWKETILCPRDGDSFVALGGEHNYPYATANGAKADALELKVGDRATLVRSDLPGLLAEWRVERAE
jgi:hypothetical protein